MINEYPNLIAIPTLHIVRNAQNPVIPYVLVNLSTDQVYLPKRKMGTLMDMDPKFLLEGNDRDCTQDMRNTFETLRCKFYRQYLRILKEVAIIEELFQSIHQKFLAAIDHLDYYPQYSNNTREKRFIHEGKYYPKRQYEELNKEESAFLDTILNEIQRLHLRSTRS